MSDEIVEQAHSDSALGPAARPNPHLLAYDFFKHMTSLSVLTLGGMLTLSGSIFAEMVSSRNLLVAMGLIAAAGVTAFTAQIEMVEWAHRDTAKPRWSARWGRGIVPMLYGGGVGAFLAMVEGALR